MACKVRTIGSRRSPASECESGYTKGDVLGAGEQGTAYALVRNADGRNIRSTHVMKISDISNDEEGRNRRSVWIDEACLSKVLGDLGLGPKIYDSWICKSDGYIIMQRMQTDLRHYTVGRARIGEKTALGENVDHIGRAPESILKDYVLLLERMIDAGYIHNDNHPGNLGIIKVGRSDRGILFDFGFTRERKDMTDADKMNALGFSLGQIIEHTPRDELATNYIYKIMTSIEKGTYVWGSGAVSVSPDDIATFDAYYGSAFTDYKKIKTPIGLMRDLYLGFKLYNYLLQHDRADRYELPYYGTIYDIRTNTPIEDESRGATSRNAFEPIRSLRRRETIRRRGGRRLTRRLRRT
jgi:hypothetical protein